MRTAAAAAWCSLVVLGLGACAGEKVREGYVGPAAMNEEQITRLLNEQGYTGITGLHKNGSDWIGAAMKGSVEVNFDVDKDGKITTK